MKVHTRNTMGYVEKSWEVPRWLLAQRLFRRKVGQLSVGWFMFFNLRFLFVGISLARSLAEKPRQDGLP